MAFLLINLISLVVALDQGCYSYFNRNTLLAAPYTCGSPRNHFEEDLCFLGCGFCTSPDLNFALSPDEFLALCGAEHSNPPRSKLSAVIATALVTGFQAHGFFWNNGPGEPEQNATAALVHLITFMPRSDLLLLFTKSYDFVEFLFEHVRLSLQTRSWSQKMNVSWPVFLDNVLPYAVMNEKRDLNWRWRPKFMQLFSNSIKSAQNLTDAVRILSNIIPNSQPEGVLSFTDNKPNPSYLWIPGMPISWVSETSPGYMSPQQVSQHGASCTGTGIIMVAICRSVGIPARLAGCSESIVRGDDHHWIEFWDPRDPGPFKDFWHTKEGVSYGNEGGPWDSPSAPMAGCLEGVIPGSKIDTLWATQWSSSVNLPFLWSDSKWFEDWSHVGGVNRCGAYCSSWGCSVNRSQYWDQHTCGPK